MIEKALEVLIKEGVIAYPTEAVYGLGCDPFSETAVKKLLQLKKREVRKGLILIAASWDQVKALTQPISSLQFSRVMETWPGPATWLFPASEQAPTWITGKHPSIALRVTAHPLAKTLCEKFGGPLVSTSANLEGLAPATTREEVLNYFPQGIDLIVAGELGQLDRPTPIRDAISGEWVRV